MCECWLDYMIQADTEILHTYFLNYVVFSKPGYWHAHASQ